MFHVERDENAGSGTMPDLEKRIAGTALSAAELIQRRNAALSRWGHAHTIVAAGVAAGALAGTKLGAKIGEKIAARRATERVVARSQETAPGPRTGSALADVVAGRPAEQPLIPKMAAKELRIAETWAQARKDRTAKALRQRSLDAGRFTQSLASEAERFRGATDRLKIARMDWRVRGAQLDLLAEPERSAARARHQAAKPKPPRMSGVAREIRHLERELRTIPPSLTEVNRRLALDPFDDPTAPSGAEERALQERKRIYEKKLKDGRAAIRALGDKTPRARAPRAGGIVRRRSDGWEVKLKPKGGAEVDLQMQIDARQTKKDHAAVIERLRPLQQAQAALGDRLAAGEISQAEHTAAMARIAKHPLWAERKAIEARPSYSPLRRRKPKGTKVDATPTPGKAWVRREARPSGRAPGISKARLKEIADAVRERARRVAMKVDLHTDKMKARRGLGGGGLLQARYLRAIKPVMVARGGSLGARIGGVVGGLAGAAVSSGALLAADRAGRWLWHTALDPAEKLAKAAPRKRTRAQAIDTAETQVATKLTAALNRVKDVAAERLSRPDGESLTATTIAELNRALSPLDEAARAGAEQPIPVTGGPGKAIAFSLGARSPQVESYIAKQRQSRVVELAGEQQDAIRAQLLQAAQAGASPQQIAQRVKETVGLTSFQANNVQNYRRELEAGSAAALKRELRDKRYDGPVQRAVDGGDALSADQVDRFVDAYHRRYLAYRATTIARTEGVGAANNGQVATAQAFLDDEPGAVVIKRWIATRDSRTRHDHALLDCQEVVGLNTPFICADGTAMRWPHDPTGPAHQICNCRCSFSIRVVRPGADQPDEDSPDATD